MKSTSMTKAHLSNQQRLKSETLISQRADNDAAAEKNRRRPLTWMMFGSCRRGIPCTQQTVFSSMTQRANHAGPPLLHMESPHFRDIYISLMNGKAPFNKGAARRMENSVRDYMTLDGLLFKIVPCGKDDYETVLCIPTSKAHILMDMYHSSLIGGHTGITKCYQMICRRFYCPNLAEQLRAYITGCHTCQMFKKGKQFQRPYQKRINLNVPAMRRISMDMKQMPPCNGYTHILVLLCEVSHYRVALPLHSTRTQHILEVFQRGYMAYFGPPSHIICDQDPAFTSSLMEAFALKLNINIILVSPTNHKSLQAEHGIKSLSGLLVKHLSEQWNWVSCLSYSSLCYNCYDFPNLDGHSPYELVFGHKMLISPKLEI